MCITFSGLLVVSIVIVLAFFALFTVIILGVRACCERTTRLHLDDADAPAAARPAHAR